MICSKFLPFKEARSFVRNLNLRSMTEWQYYRRENNITNIPSVNQEEVVEVSNNIVLEKTMNDNLEKKQILPINSNKLFADLDKNIDSLFRTGYKDKYSRLPNKDEYIAGKFIIYGGLYGLMFILLLLLVSCSPPNNNNTPKIEKSLSTSSNVKDEVNSSSPKKELNISSPAKYTLYVSPSLTVKYDEASSTINKTTVKVEAKSEKLKDEYTKTFDLSKFNKVELYTVEYNRVLNPSNDWLDPRWVTDGVTINNLPHVYSKIGCNETSCSLQVLYRTANNTLALVTYTQRGEGESWVVPFHLRANDLELLNKFTFNTGFYIGTSLRVDGRYVFDLLDTTLFPDSLIEDIENINL